MLIEMHCHTSEHSPCSTVPAVELVQRVWARRLQGLVLTDHFYQWPDRDLAELRRESGVPDDFLIVSGHETNVPIFGDVLVYGAPAAIPRGTPLEEIRARYPEAALVWAHPYRDGREPTRDQILSPLFDAIEIFNSNHTVRGNSRGLREWRQFGFAATGGTDTHASTYAGIYPTEFQPPVLSLAELVAALKSGRCRPYLREIPHREAGRVVEVRIGTPRQEGERGAAESVIIRAPGDHASWSKAERAFHIMSAIAERGLDKGSLRVPRPVEKDSESRVLIEEAVGGTSLFERIVAAPPDQGREYLRLAARWLARLHALRLRVTPVDEFLAEERRRLDGELRRFSEAGHPYTAKLAEIAAAVKEAERGLAETDAESFVQGHGDFHPKNIRIAPDPERGPGAYSVVAIDFERSQCLPPAFDVGWFLAQFRSQFSDYPQIRRDLEEEVFLRAYTGEAGPGAADFLRRVELFRARTNISIAAFFLKMGLGKSRELWRILVEAERALLYLV